VLVTAESACGGLAGKAQAVVRRATKPAFKVLTHWLLNIVQKFVTSCRITKKVNVSDSGFRKVSGT